MNTSQAPYTFLDRGIDWLSRILSLIFLCIVGITTYEVIMRYAFNAPTFWAHELAIFLGGTLFIIGGAYALATDKHVRVVLLYDRAGPRLRHVLNIFHNIMGMFFSGMMAWAAYKMAYEAWFKPWGDLMLETSGTAWDTSFPAYLKATIFITMLILFAQFTLKLIAECRSLWGDRYV